MRLLLWLHGAYGQVLLSNLARRYYHLIASSQIIGDGDDRG